MVSFSEKKKSQNLQACGISHCTNWVTVSEGVTTTTSSPTLTFGLFGSSHPKQCELVSHSSFDVQFSDALVMLVSMLFSCA